MHEKWRNQVRPYVLVFQPAIIAVVAVGSQTTGAYREFLDAVTWLCVEVHGYSNVQKAMIALMRS